MDELRDFMEQAGLTQVELARIVGITQPAISALLNGKYDPTWTIYHKFERAFTNPNSKHFNPQAAPAVALMYKILAMGMERS